MPIDFQYKEDSDFLGNRSFASALLDPDMDIPAGMVGPDGNPAPKRFSVYRNNVVFSLMEAMAETYPAIKKLIGEENFFMVVRIFITENPPSSPMMQAYGDLFPAFLQKFKPLQHAPFLVDVANAEKYWINAYHATDTPPLNGNCLGKLEPQKLEQIRFKTHPAAHIACSRYALYDLFSMRNNEDKTEVSYEECQSPQAILITRPYLRVETNGLNHAMAEFFKAIIIGATLEESIEKAMQADKDFNASSAIALMLTSGATTEISDT